MEKHWHNVSDLSPPARSVVEELMGQPLRDDQRVCIVAFDAASEFSAEDRRQAWNELAEIMAETHAHVRESGASAAELEREIDDACEEVRNGTKPCG